MSASTPALASAAAKPVLKVKAMPRMRASCAGGGSVRDRQDLDMKTITEGPAEAPMNAAEPDTTMQAPSQSFACIVFFDPRPEKIGLPTPGI